MGLKNFFRVLPILLRPPWVGVGFALCRELRPAVLRNWKARFAEVSALIATATVRLG